MLNARSSQALLRGVFINGVVFVAVMMTLTMMIGRNALQVVADSDLMVGIHFRQVEASRTLGDIDRMATSERRFLRLGDRQDQAAYQAAQADLVRRVAALLDAPAVDDQNNSARSARELQQAAAAWHRANVAAIEQRVRQGSSVVPPGVPPHPNPLEGAARAGLAAYQDSTLADARRVAARSRAQIRTAGGLGLVRIVLAVAFFVFLGLRQYRLLAGAFDAYIQELTTKNAALERQSVELGAQRAQLDLQAKQLGAHNEELEERVQQRTEELRQATEVAEAASEAKSAFLANISHELRTPLNAILGYTDIVTETLELEQFAARADALSDLQKVRTASRHLLDLIDDVLDLSKIEAGKLEVHLEPIDITELVADVVDTIGPLAAKRGNDLDVTVQQEAPAIVTDVQKLRQCLVNLLSNACKFTERGRVQLEVGVVGEGQPNAGPRGTLVCRVADTGIGMSPEQVARLFQPFHQADASITRKYGGTGLGLAISQRFCELLGGHIDVESELGRGTTFTVTLPLPSAARITPIDA